MPFLHPISFLSTSRERRGFTLLEILIVVAILAFLASIAIPNYVSYRKTSQMNACLSNLAMLNSATTSYLLRHKVAVDTDLTIDMLAPKSSAEAKDKYFLTRRPECPCGGTYSYDRETQLWHCSFGGNSEANGGFPHGDRAN